jgi:carbon monoxide dehydrogenase subunit G
MLRFEGDRDFPQPPAELYARLTDPHFLAGCVPDVETVKEAGPDHAALVLRPNLAFVRGTLDVTIRVVEKTPPSAARLLLTGKGIGSSSTTEAVLTFSSQGDGTRVHWTAEVKELGGLLKMVPHGLIRGAAEKVLGDAWAAVAARMGGR